MAVQNTYLKTFQSLGALGLLLGTLGLAIAQLRSALERQGELAVMRAIGFSRYRLGSSVMIEAVYLLLLGIGCGLLCSAIAIAPNVLAGQVLPPVAQPLLAILGIVIVGLVAGAVTVARVVRMPLIQSLRQG
jgi:ABC-type antimicrobial peptide transport system permease subunit